MSRFQESVAEETRRLMKLAGGAVFYLATRVTSDGILTTARALTGSVVIGQIAVEDIILKTNGVGLAGGATLKITCDNQESGTTVIMQHAVGNLGASVTISLSKLVVDPNLLGQTAPGAGGTTRATWSISAPTTIEKSRGIFIESSNAACTGAGTVDVILKLRRLVDGADLTMRGNNLYDL